MDALRRATQEAEKPGRLQLAILEWQRQLVARREAPLVGRLREPDHQEFGGSWRE